MPAFAPITYLAQAASVFGWLLVLIVLVVVGFVVITWVRKWMKEDDIPTGGTGFGLGELRQMHARGDITTEEYERARAKMTASAKAITTNMPDPAGGRRAPGASSVRVDMPISPPGPPKVYVQPPRTDSAEGGSTKSREV